MVNYSKFDTLLIVKEDITSRVYAVSFILTTIHTGNKKFLLKQKIGFLFRADERTS